jgi:hypothetical protein
MSNIKYVEPKDAKELERLQDQAIRATVKARESVQIAAVATLIHAAKHGDWTGANRLTEGLGNTINGQALVKFFVDFGGLTINADESGFGGWAGADFIREHLDAAKAKMWWELRKVNPFAGYNADVELKKFVDKFAKMRKQLPGLPNEEATKVSFIINEDTMRAVMHLVPFEEIVHIVETDAAPEEPATDDHVANQKELAA